MIIATDSKGNLVAQCDGHDGHVLISLSNGTTVRWEEKAGVLTSAIIEPRQVQFCFPTFSLRTLGGREEIKLPEAGEG